jgi:hypothetical protein
MQTTNLATIESYVTRAERDGGGWVQIVFHYVCDGCDPYSVSEQNFSEFVTWLSARSALGTRVETVRAVINTPFVPGAIRVSGGTRGGVRLSADKRCPSTPVTAPCVREPGIRAGAQRVPAAGTLIVSTGAPASGVLLELARRKRGGRPVKVKVAARALGGTGLRWKVVLTGSVPSRSGALFVTFPLGVARYPLRLNVELLARSAN